MNARTLIVALFAFAGAAQAQCVVRDPELQGRYEGPCVAGMAEGQGSASGSAEYRGGFRAGMKHGQGVKRWPATGDRYEGDYAHDQRNGTGTYTWSSGDQYTGPWERDAQAGLQTPRQQQRTRASKARLAVIGKPGMLVCGAARVGIADRRRVQSEVVEVLQDRLLLKIRTVDGRPPANPDVVFWDLVTNWNPCR